MRLIDKVMKVLIFPITFYSKLMDRIFKQNYIYDVYYKNTLKINGENIIFEGFIESGILEYIFPYCGTSAEFNIINYLEGKNGSIKSKRAIYDAVLRINKKICKKTIAKKPLLIWDSGTISLNNQLFINQEEK